MKTKQQTIDNLTWIQIKHGDDLLKSITQYCIDGNIQAGFIMAIGALQKATFSFYNQHEKKFYEHSISEPTEIISCLGNISIKDGKPFVHAHLSLSDDTGKMLGGHLNEGCVVFAAECAVCELEGDSIERKLDDVTGLSLWEF